MSGCIGRRVIDWHKIQGDLCRRIGFFIEEPGPRHPAYNPDHEWFIRARFAQQRALVIKRAVNPPVLRDWQFVECVRICC